MLNRNILTLVLLSIISLSYGCLDKGSGQKTLESKKTSVFYTCSMHPHIKEKKPGKCPICHMNLTKVEEFQEAHHMKSSSTKIDKKIWQCADHPDVTSEVEEICPIDGTKMIPVTNIVNKAIASVRLRKAQVNHFRPAIFTVTPMKMSKKIRVLGSVLQSEEKESKIPARVDGRVEKVFVKSTGSFVRVGDPVVSIYSPKLITAGEEYLIARKTLKNSKGKEFKELLSKSQERLELWGIGKDQYEKWYEDKKIPKEITIYSNSTGIVRKRNAIVGKYFKEGQNFFEISNLSEVWVEMDVYEHDSLLVNIGQVVDLSFSAIPGEHIKGKIDFVAPVLDNKSRTLKVRTTIKNVDGKLKPGMVANVTLNVDLPGMPLVVPRSAIIDTGKRKVAWLKKANNEFQAVPIHSGFESSGYIAIKHGLKVGDEVVIEGNFLLDAQAQLFGGYEDLSKEKMNVHNH